MIEIPADMLGDDILRAIVEAFILREGTDYGGSEVSLEGKVSQILDLVKRGEIVVTFDEGSESCNLMTKQEYRHLKGSVKEG